MTPTTVNLAELDKSWDGAHEELEMGYRDIRKSLDISSMVSYFFVL